VRKLGTLSPVDRAKSALLVVICLTASAVGSPARASSYYEGNRPYRLGNGVVSFGGSAGVSASVDVATGALQVDAPLSVMPSLVPVIGGWAYTSQDSSNGPLGKGTSLPYDFFIVSIPGSGPPYEVIAPGNRHFSFAAQNGNGDWINTRDGEVLGATLHFLGTGLQSDLRWRTGEVFSFDSTGNLVTVKNRFGASISIFRNSLGFPTTIWQYGARQVNFTYDPTTNRLKTVYYQYDRNPNPVNRS
jgi:hypothetical protein